MAKEVDDFYKNKSRYDLLKASREGTIFERICHKKRVETAQNTMDLNTGRILDLGCGAGLFSINLAKHGGSNIIGADISIWALKQLKEHCVEENVNVPCVRCDMQFLPFKDCVFDSVLCLGVLEHVLDVDKKMTEIFRVLEHNAFLMASMPNKYHPLWNFKTIRRMLSRYKEHTAEPFHKKYSLGGLTNLLSSSGFKVNKRFYSIYFTEVNVVGVKHDYSPPTLRL